PTEAEWEYAARGGTSGPYFFGGSPKDYTSEGFWKKIFGKDTTIISTFAIYKENSLGRTHLPEAVAPNPFGLKHMLGNVAEFCSDYYSSETYKTYQSGVKDPKGPESGEEFVIRGGSFNADAADLRAADREYTRTKDWLKTDPQMPKSIWWYSDALHIGFRVVCEYNEQ
ncbi:MAG: SUMF1/EgtB/PvdO family nonheme iron enzyme, partial [Bacteroidales bacterium]|nr:SUMF1/EgtB/PvdO family nonheme iron enzyme [Bacteroidales bacterium]